MKNQTATNVMSSEFNDRSSRFSRLKDYYVHIGRIATNALVITRTSFGPEMTLPQPVPSFIQTYLARRHDTMQHPRTMADISDFIERSNEIIAKAKTVFPLDPFPDTVALDRTKLTVTTRDFLRSDVMSIRIEDILNVSSFVGPFFGSLTIATRVLSSNDHFTIRLLKRKDAMHLKHVIQGFVIARHNNISCDHMDRDELLSTLMELGRDSNRDRRKARTVRAPTRLLKTLTR